MGLLFLVVVVEVVSVFVVISVMDLLIVTCQKEEKECIWVKYLICAI